MIPGMSISPEPVSPEAERRPFTVQCGYGSWNVCTVVVEASRAEEACALAIEDANDSLDWRELVSCSPTSVDAMAEGYQVDVWAEAGAGSKLPIPIAFGEHAEADMLWLALWSLLAWAEQTGGCDAPCWTEARALFDEPCARLEGEPAAARSDAQ